MFNLDKIYKALFFAVKAHEGQKMKQPSNVDYTAHIFGVALTALNYIEKENVDKSLVVIVALLHDVLEDTSVSYDEIKNVFGIDVANGVIALTKNENLPYEDQMEDSLNRIINLNKKEIAIVKLADRCFNTRCKVENWSTERQIEYYIEAKKICDKIGFYCAPLQNKILENIANWKIEEVVL